MKEYLIFARKEYQQPLECLGQLTVESGSASDDAPTAEVIERARQQFNGPNWIEMIALPNRAVIRVIPME